MAKELTSPQDIWEDPTAFGMPTFDEFCKKPEYWMGGKEDVFAEVDRGSQLFRRKGVRPIYEIEGYRVKTLEKVQEIVRNQGIEVVDYMAIVQPVSSWEADILVKFMSKDDVKRREEYARTKRRFG